jgi:hypothetical protein
MTLSLTNLAEQTRQLMLDEIELDLSKNTLYFSPRLSQSGHNDYSSLLKDAVTTHDDIWLVRELRVSGRLNSTETRRKPKGGITTAKVPVTAADTLGEGEFNRFYIRAVCRRSIDSGSGKVIVYRAKEVSSPRPESQRKIGMEMDAQSLLNDLRSNPGVDTALGLPPGPNSGLSVRLL